MTPSSQQLIPVETIADKIFLIRGQKVMLDRDLAQLYGVETKALNQAVKRNQDRFPDDFMFQLTAQEAKLLRCHFGTSNLESQSGTSRLNLDGDPLMNRAFGCDNGTPALKFNSLSADAERDEQKGFLFLFEGIVGLRNSKANSNRLFGNPSRAQKYLALASLLVRLLELASQSLPSAQKRFARCANLSLK